jgi:hypothetical protein
MSERADKQFHGIRVGSPEAVAAHSDRTVITIASPEDLLAWLPYGLGFHPFNCLCLLALDIADQDGPALIRIDLPVEPDEVKPWADYLVSWVKNAGARTVMLIGYGPGDKVTPVIEASMTAAREVDIDVYEALLVENGRYWSYLCTEVACCPPEGTPYDQSTSRISAQATLNGMVALANREELERTVAPLGSAGRTSIIQATVRAEQRIVRWATENGVPSVCDRMVDEGLPFVRDLIEWGGLLNDDEVAWLGILLTHPRVFIEAWVRTDENHLDMWRDMMRRVDDNFAVVPACLTAYAAYLSGNGALANVALDRAFQIENDHPMAKVLRDMIQAGAHPSKLRVKITPEELSAAYDRLSAEVENSRFHEDGYE